MNNAPCAPAMIACTIPATRNDSSAAPTLPVSTSRNNGNAHATAAAAPQRVHPFAAPPVRAPRRHVDPAIHGTVEARISVSSVLRPNPAAWVP